MTVIEQGKCKIERLNAEGLGVSRSLKGVIELPYTLPGEIVEFERHKYRGKTNCILRGIAQESPSRIKPQCRYFGACGGCSLQHLQADEYKKFKTNLIQNLLDEAQISTTLKPIILIPFGCRRKANLKVLKKNDHIYLGFHRFHSHQIINIEECPAILKNLSKLIKPLKQLCNLILTNSQKAEIYLSQAVNGAHISIVTASYVPLTSFQLKKLAEFAADNQIIQIIFENEKSKEVVYHQSLPVVEFDDKKVDIEANSFLQTSTYSDVIFKDLILNFFTQTKEITNKTVVDLFCGRGTFTLALTKYFKVSGFESDSTATAALGRSIKAYNLTADINERDLFVSPLLEKELNKFDYVVINPPRVGAKAQCQELAKSNIKKIAYISCNPQSFIKDMRILIHGGYSLIEVTPVDQFPMTAHLELVATFQKETD